MKITMKKETGSVNWIDWAQEMHGGHSKEILRFLDFCIILIDIHGFIQALTILL